MVAVVVDIVLFRMLVPLQFASPLNTNRCALCHYCCYRHSHCFVDAETPAIVPVGINGNLVDAAVGF